MRAARERLGWSRDALAFHSGVSSAGVAQIESGRRKNTRPSTLSALAQALGITIDYLVHEGSAPATMLDHQLLLYRTDKDFVAATGPFLTEGMERAEALLAVTTKSNIELLRDVMGPSVQQIELIEASTWYRSPVTALTAYRRFVSDRIDAGASWVRIIGEPIWAGQSDAQTRLWAQYESLLNLAFAHLPVTILCPYDETLLDPAIANTARLTHPVIHSVPAVATNPLFRDPGEFVLEPHEEQT